MDSIVATRQPAVQLGWRQSPWLSAAEFLIGAGIVIGHNEYHVVPNEVPILFRSWLDFKFTSATAAGKRSG